ncbi:MAG: type II secretion system protein, partial [Candidatus Saccharimonadales bacterium]
MNKNKQGFTIVETVVVICVIAILAAIATFYYTKVQQQAHD